MKNMLLDLRAPAVISAMLVLPLMILEWLNRRDFHEDYPIALFGYYGCCRWHSCSSCADGAGGTGGKQPDRKSVQPCTESRRADPDCMAVDRQRGGSDALFSGGPELRLSI